MPFTSASSSSQQPAPAFLDPNPVSLCLHLLIDIQVFKAFRHFASLVFALYICILPLTPHLTFLSSYLSSVIISLLSGEEGWRVPCLHFGLWGAVTGVPVLPGWWSRQNIHGVGVASSIPHPSSSSPCGFGNRLSFFNSSSSKEEKVGSAMPMPATMLLPSMPCIYTCAHACHLPAFAYGTDSFYSDYWIIPDWIRIPGGWIIPGD